MYIFNDEDVIEKFNLGDLWLWSNLRWKLQIQFEVAVKIADNILHKKGTLGWYEIDTKKRFRGSWRSGQLGIKWWGRSKHGRSCSRRPWNYCIAGKQEVDDRSFNNIVEWYSVRLQQACRAVCSSGLAALCGEHGVVKREAVEDSVLWKNLLGSLSSWSSVCSTLWWEAAMSTW